jgi:hypothetical protein
VTRLDLLKVADDKEDTMRKLRASLRMLYASKDSLTTTNISARIDNNVFSTHTTYYLSELGVQEGTLRTIGILISNDIDTAITEKEARLKQLIGNFEKGV